MPLWSLTLVWVSAMYALVGIGIGICVGNACKVIDGVCMSVRWWHRCVIM